MIRKAVLPELGEREVNSSVLPEMTLHLYGKQDLLTGKRGDVPGNSSQSQRGWNTDCGHGHLESVAIVPSLYLEFYSLHGVDSRGHSKSEQQRSLGASIHRASSA